MGNIAKLLRSKTVWGAIITSGAWLLKQPHIQVPEVFEAIGAVWTVLGARDAIHKAGDKTPEARAKDGR